MTECHDDRLFNIVDEVRMMQVEEKDRKCNNGDIADKWEQQNDTELAKYTPHHYIMIIV